ncbi:MAG: hydantoinase/oxoprolinase family protein [Burkholderiales bacterium]|nr:hydantoinase/oxoprolinase family protein [Burkholderiales bacterium]
MPDTNEVGRAARYRLGIDVGGTFTDLCLFDEAQGTLRTYKVASTPDDFCHGIVDGVRALLAEARLPAAALGYLVHGTTVATNAMIQRSGGRVGLLTTAGFRDLLEIRRQSRPHDELYNLFFVKAPTPIPRHLRLEVPERILADGSIWLPLDEAATIRAIEELVALRVETIAICLLNSYVDARHEQRLVELVREHAPGVDVSASYQVLREFREFERLSTTVVNAWLQRPVGHYLQRLESRIAEERIKTAPFVMQGNGGIMSVEAAVRGPVNLLVSGPSAGLMGAIYTARAAGFDNLLTFDMGGTSTDVSLVQRGAPIVRTDNEVAGYPVRVPMLDIKFIGAGGGSVAWINEGGALKVGPRSTGAHPGPACYAQGGREATVTDANVTLGFLHPERLLGGRKAIDRTLACDAIMANVARPLGLDLSTAAHGIRTIVNTNMVGALKLVSVEQGYDPRDFALVAFGGAGPLHASAVARELGMRTVIVPESPGILCALGLLTVDRRFDIVRTAVMAIREATVTTINDIWNELDGEATRWLEGEGVPVECRGLVRIVDARYRGQNYELALPVSLGIWTDATLANIERHFHEEHERIYGFHSEKAAVQMVNFRTVAQGIMPKPSMARRAASNSTLRDAQIGVRSVSWEAERAPAATPVYARERLAPGHELIGPAIAEQMDTTIVIAPGEHARVDDYLNLVIDLSCDQPARGTRMGGA